MTGVRRRALVVALGRYACACACAGVTASAGCGLDVVGSLVAPPGPDASEASVEASLPPPSEIDASGSDGGADAPSDALVDVVSEEASVGPCDDPTLILCMRFEDSVADEARAQVATVTGSVSYVAGKEGKAISLDSADAVTLPHDGTVWSYTALSVELWVKPAALPLTGARAGLIDKNNSFGVFLQPGGAISCVLGGSVSVSSVVSVGTWTHVACTSDGVTMRLYADGVLLVGVPSPALALQTELTAIGSNSPSGDPLSGQLDTLRVFSRARTAQEIAAAAGK
jgi:Concanavalin A-like lectin/glucanases superfamily